MTSCVQDTALQLRSQLNELWLGANGHFGPDAQSYATYMLQSFSVMREYNGWGTGPAMSTPKTNAVGFARWCCYLR